jgi:hypothetical protein
MRIVMEIVLRCSLPPGAELLPILEDRQTRIFRSIYFIFCVSFRVQRAQLRLSCGFYSALHMSVFLVAVMDCLRTYDMLTLLELRNKEQGMLTE